MASRDELAFEAKVSEQLERYTDLVCQAILLLLVDTLLVVAGVALVT